MKTGVIALMLVLMTTISRADDVRGFRISTPLIYSVAAGADLWTTERVLALPGGVERNPLGQHLSHRVGLKVLMIAGCSFTDAKLRKRGHPRAANILRIGIVLAHIGVAAHNYRESRIR